ncbi:MAG: HD domain-containing protein [Clostridiales bacterium]|nr:HD domain-containing protein [Clostridiales bacterium]
MNLKEIDHNGTVEGFVLVKSCEKKNAKNGSVYLDMRLCDNSGEIVAKSWDFREGNFLPEVNSIVKVRGVISDYNNVPQLRVDRVRQVYDSDNVDMSLIIPSSEYDSGFMLESIRSRVNSFNNEQLKKLVTAMLDEYGDRMLGCPAAFRLHHAIRGGLLMHTLTVAKLCDCVSDIYPSIDRELLISGAILHDLCKIDEFNLSPVGLAQSYTVEGSLIGHLVMGAIAVDRVARENDIDRDTVILIEHMLISHHGEPEYGAASRPLFLEAEVLSALDSLDANIYEIENALNGVDAGSFSTKQWALDDRKFYNHGRTELSTRAILDNTQKG